MVLYGVVDCPSCGATLNIKSPRLFGKRLPCPKCKTRVVVPGQRTEVASEPDDGDAGTLFSRLSENVEYAGVVVKEVVRYVRYDAFHIKGGVIGALAYPVVVFGLLLAGLMYFPRILVLVSAWVREVGLEEEVRNLFWTSVFAVFLSPMGITLWLGFIVVGVLLGWAYGEDEEPTNVPNKGAKGHLLKDGPSDLFGLTLISRSPERITPHVKRVANWGGATLVGVRWLAVTCVSLAISFKWPFVGGIVMLLGPCIAFNDYKANKPIVDALRDHPDVYAASPHAFVNRRYYGFCWPILYITIVAACTWITARCVMDFSELWNR